MSNIELKPLLVEKEFIPKLSFSDKTEVKQQHNHNLMQKLSDATSLGNIHHRKVFIIFEDDEGIKKVDTTIWCTGRDYICLKGGLWLPVSRIHDIEF